MEILIKFLGALAAVGFVIFGILYAGPNKAAGIWVFFASTSILLFDVCYFWQKALKQPSSGDYSGVTDVLAPPTFLHGSWSKMNGPYGGSVTVLAIDPADRSQVLAGIASLPGVLSSKDAGRTWSVVGRWPNDRPIHSVAALRHRSGSLLAGINCGLLIKGPHEDRWREVEYFHALEEAEVRSLATTPSAPRIIYCATGEHWFGARFTSAAAATVAATHNASPPIKIKWVESTSEGHLHRSTDGGQTWTTGSFPSINGVRIAPSNPLVIYAASSDEGVFVTTDGGTNWRQNNLGTRKVSYSVAISPLASNRAIVGTSRGAFLTSDSGQNWKLVKSIGEQEVTAVAFAQDGGEAFAGTRTGFYASSDAGESFQLASTGLFHRLKREEPTGGPSRRHKSPTGASLSAARASASCE